jgi:hypothetical protein
MSSLIKSTTITIFALTTFAPEVCAQADPFKDEQEFVARVNRAIERGKRFLIQQEGGKGHWEGILEPLADQEGGQTALVTLALLTSGVKPDEPVMQRALTYLRRLEPKKTYVVGLTTMALAEARKPEDLLRIQKNVDWLLQTAIRRGGQLQGWSYPMNPIPDASNTQFALLGLYAGKTAGAKIPDSIWKDIRNLYTSIQRSDGPTSGFWQYDYSRPVGGHLSGPSFTMTVAGVCGLLIAEMGLNESRQELDIETGIAARCGVYETNGPIQKGMNWVASHFSFEAAPGLKTVFYNVYGIERLGRLSGQRFIGRYDWYREGCEFLIRTQDANGRWHRPDKLADRIEVLATSFALLFLSKGKTPILITKLAYGDFGGGVGGMLVERGDEPGKVGWNRKQNDVRHLTEFASRELFNGLPLGWQVYDPRRASFTPKQIINEVGSLLASPIVYMNGHRAPVLSGEQKEILKRYIDEGGFLFAEACCGSPEFIQGFEELMREMFPDNQLTDMTPEHPIWRAYFAVSPADFQGLKVLERGCKTVAVFSPIPLAGYWEENRFMVKKGVDATNRGERAFRLAGNIIAYATGMEPPQQRGTVVRVVDAAKDASPPRGTFKPAQLKLREENHPAPAAMRNLMAHLQATTRLETILDKQSIAPGDFELMKYKFIYLHGRKRVNLQDDEIENLKMNLETGGLLLADSACGKREFDESFRELVKRMYPDKPLEVIPLDDELYSSQLNGVSIRTVKRREKSDGDGPDGGFRDLPPHLEGVKIDGRWAIIYSKYDLGCSLEGHRSTDCLGHSKESALQLAAAAVLYSLKQ